ncbi:MAG: putative nucleic-acid-binding protein [Ramlibacter sp.]|nr:putative nucleic-acid-binding protein [Ramlibacter sp.]
MTKLQKTNPTLFFLEGEAPGAPGLKGSRCGCGQTVLLQVAACPRCGRRDLETVCIGQRATLGESAEVFHSADGFEAPYFIGMIETEQGPRTFAPIAAAPGTALRPGMALKFRLLERADGRVGFAYAPAEARA